MSPQKLFFLFITYLLEDEQELSLGMLIRCKRIHNFLMFHAWFYLLSYVLSTLWSNFHMISWTNLLTRPTVRAACFLLFLVPGSQKMNILEIGRDKSQIYYFTGGQLEPEYETKKGHRAATPPGYATRLGPRQEVVWPAQAPPRPLLPPIYCL